MTKTTTRDLKAGTTIELDTRFIIGAKWPYETILATVVRLHKVADHGIQIITDKGTTESLSRSKRWVVVNAESAPQAPYEQATQVNGFSID